MLLDIRQLEYVMALGRFRNFARAAESLGISSPALSKGIAALERVLDVRLFERGRGGVTPTAFGDFLCTGASSVVGNVDGIVRELHRMKGLEAGSIVVGAGPFALEMSVTDVVCRLAARHPGLQVQIVVGDWRTFGNDVLQGRLDAAVAELTLAEQEPRLLAERLGGHSGVFYCRNGHPLTGKTPLRFKDIAHFPFAFAALPPKVVPFFQQVDAAGRVDPATGDFLPAFTVNSFPVMKRIVLSTDAISWAPENLLANELQDGRLVALPHEAPWACLNYGLMTARGRTPSPALAAFIAEIRTVEKELTPRANGKRAMPAAQRGSRG